ncbi:MAG: FHA domain-containing serine/threonine-protein kinase [Planctomycetota bacterium]
MKICPRDNLEFSDSLRFCPQCGSPLRDLDPRVDRIVGGSYKLLGQIGQGWAGQVSRAVHVMMGKDVALKVITTDRTLSNEQVERFREWARVITNLTDESVAVIHDLWLSERKTIYIATELIKGKNLRQVLTEEGPMPGEFFLRVIRQICRALRTAHDHEIFHGDLKPTNVMVMPGDANEVVVKVLDFGTPQVLAIATAGDEEAMRKFAAPFRGGMVFAEPEYASPEQIEGKAPNAASDVYSLGVMMYEMLTGARPFRGESAEELLRAHLEETPKSMREFKPQLHIPKFIERAVLKALEKSPRHRQQTMTEVLDELDAEITEEEGARQPGATKFWERVMGLLGSKGGVEVEEELPDTDLRPRKEKGEPAAVLDGNQIAVLSRIKEGQVTETWEITSLPLRIGRSSKNDIVLDDHSVSRRHARILLQDNRLLILDENSSNGTFVNDKRTRLKKLHHGDEIQLGDIVLKFELRPKGAESAPEAPAES